MLLKIREPFNGFSHLGGAVAALFGQIALLIAGWPGTAKLLSLLVYGLSLIALFSAECSLSPGTGEAGDPTDLANTGPFCHLPADCGYLRAILRNAFTGFFRWGLLTLIWAITWAGIWSNYFMWVRRAG